MLKSSATSRPSRISAVVALMACAALTACSSAGGDNADDQGLTVGVFTGSLADLPVLVAQEKGIFTKHGLDVKTTPVAGGAAASAGLVSAQFDVVASSGSNAYVFNEKAAASKSDQRMIAVVNEVSGPYFVVLARKDANPPAATAPLKEKLAWLSSRRVGVSARGAETENIVRGIMLTNGVDPKPTTWIAAGDPTSSLSAWNGGRLDAIVSWQPAQQRIEATGTAVELVNFLELRKSEPLFAKGWSTNTWWTSSTFAGKNPKKLKGFADSIDEAIAYINDPANTDGITQMFATKHNLDQDLINKAFSAWEGVYTSELTCEAFDNAQGFYKSVGIINQTLPCNDISWTGSTYIKGLK